MMDPNAALAAIREELDAFYANYDSDFCAQRLVDYVAALDDWIKHGGFLPADWR